MGWLNAVLWDSPVGGGLALCARGPGPTVFALRERLADLGRLHPQGPVLAAIAGTQAAFPDVRGPLRARFDLELFPSGYPVRRTDSKGA